jgi:hypothetical protein
MSSNTPCVGCWWIEGGRCYQDKLASLHGLENAPRNGVFAPGNGLEITDAHLTACVERGVHERKSAVYGRLERHLRNAGIEVVHIASADGGESRS